MDESFRAVKTSWVEGLDLSGPSACGPNIRHSDEVECVCPVRSRDSGETFPMNRVFFKQIRLAGSETSQSASSTEESFTVKITSLWCRHV